MLMMNGVWNDRKGAFIKPAHLFQHLGVGNLSNQIISKIFRKKSLKGRNPHNIRQVCSISAEVNVIGVVVVGVIQPYI